MAVSVQRPGVYTPIVTSGEAPIPVDPAFGGVIVGPVYDVVEAFPSGVASSTARFTRAPSVTPTNLASYNIGGRVLRYKVDGGAERTLTFPGGTDEALSRTIVQNQIDSNAVGIHVVVINSTSDAWQIVSDTSGSNATLEFVLASGTAATTLGLTTGTTYRGVSLLGVGNQETGYEELPANKGTAAERTVDTSTLRVYGVHAGATTEFETDKNFAAHLSQMLYRSDLDGSGGTPTETWAAPYGLGPVTLEPVSDGSNSLTTTYVKDRCDTAYAWLLTNAIKVEACLLDADGAATGFKGNGGNGKTITITEDTTTDDIESTVASVSTLTITGSVDVTTESKLYHVVRFGDPCEIRYITAVGVGDVEEAFTIDSAFTTMPEATDVVTITPEKVSPVSDGLTAVIYAGKTGETNTTNEELVEIINNHPQSKYHLVASLGSSTQPTLAVAGETSAVQLQWGRGPIAWEDLHRAGDGAAAKIISAKPATDSWTVTAATNDKLFIQYGFDGVTYEVTIDAQVAQTTAATADAIQTDITAALGGAYVTCTAQDTRLLFADARTNAMGIQSYLRISGSFVSYSGHFDLQQGYDYIETFGVPFMGAADATSLGAGFVLEGLSSSISVVNSMQQAGGESRLTLDTPVDLTTSAGAVNYITPKAIKATGLSSSSVAITDIPPALVVGTDSFTTYIREIAKSFTAYVDFKALRTDLFGTVTNCASDTDIETYIGEITTANPVALMLHMALQQSDGLKIGFVGIDTNNSAGYDKAIQRLERAGKFYISLASTAEADIEVLQSYLDTWAGWYNYKRGVVGVSIPTEKKPTTVAQGTGTTTSGLDRVQVTLADGTLNDAFVAAGYPTSANGLQADADDGYGFYIRVIGDPNKYLISSFADANTVMIKRSGFTSSEKDEGFWYGSTASSAPSLPSMTAKTVVILRRAGELGTTSSQDDVVDAMDELRDRLESDRCILVPSTVKTLLDSVEVTLGPQYAAADLLGWKVAHNPAESFAGQTFDNLTAVVNDFGGIYIDESHWDEMSGFCWLVQDTPASMVTARDEMTSYVIDVDVVGTIELFKMENSAGAGLEALDFLLKERLRPFVADPINDQTMGDISLAVSMATHSAVYDYGFVAECHILGVEQDSSNLRRLLVTLQVRPAYPADLIQITVVVSGSAG